MKALELSSHQGQPSAWPRSVPSPPSSCSSSWWGDRCTCLRGPCPASQQLLPVHCLTATKVTTPHGTPSLSETPRGQSQDGCRAACTLLSEANGKCQLLTGSRENTNQFRISSGFWKASRASLSFLNRTSLAIPWGWGKRAGDESDSSKCGTRRERAKDCAGKERRTPSCSPSPSARGQSGPQQRAAPGRARPQHGEEGSVRTRRRERGGPGRNHTFQRSRAEELCERRSHKGGVSQSRGAPDDWT